MKKKIAIVCSGGGTRCAYSAGALYALATNYHLEKPDIAIAASGSAGSMLYYIARQYELGRKVWTNLLARREFASLLRPWRILNVDYLVDVIFKQEVPIDRIELKKTPIKYFIATTNNDTTNIEYFTNKSNGDVYEILRAAKAIPFLYNKMVCINHHLYLDGDFLGLNTHTLIQKALSEKADLVIAIDTSPTPRSLGKLLLKILSWVGTKRMRRGARRELHAISLNPTYKDVEVVHVHAPRYLPVSPISNDRKKLTKTFNLGYRDTYYHPDIRRVLGEPQIFTHKKL